MKQCIVLAVLILGFSLNYWVTASLSDWLSYILTDARVEAAMRAGGRSMDRVVVTAVSQGDAAQTADLTLTTRADYRVFVPMVVRP